MSRRGFLRSGALTAVGACALGHREWVEPARAREKPSPDAAMRLGIASYSFHKFDRARVIECMQHLQCRYLNVKDVNDHLPMTPASATDEALAAYRAAGIVLTAVGVVYFPSQDSADIARKFEYAKRAGVPLIVGSPAVEALPEVEKCVKQYDLRLAIHNHGPEDKVWPSPLDVLKAIEPMDKRMGVCIDLGHTARTGTDILAAIRAAGPRLFDLHIKDLADLHSKESQVDVGDGLMPVRRIFETLHEIGYTGFVDLEYEIHEDDPLPGMMKSLAFLRGVLAGMGYQR